MATRTRKVEIEITEERKGDAFKGTAKDADQLEDKLGAAGQRAGKALEGGLDRSIRGLAAKLGVLGDRSGEELGDGVRSGFNDSIDGIGDDLKGQLTDLIAAGGIGLAFAEGIENEMSADKFAAQLGLDPARMAELGGAAGNLYANAYGDSLGDVNEAMRAVIHSGAVMEDASAKQVEGITAKVMSLADAFDQDLVMATNAAGQMVRTGLAKDADEALDIITVGLQNGTNKADDLLETFNEYSTQFRELGLDGEQALGLISQGVKAGARDADIAADALKEFAIRAQDGSEATAEGFAMIGLSADEMAQMVARGGPRAAEALDMTLDRIRAMPDPAQQAAAAVALFGTQSEDMQNALLSMDLTTAVSELGRVKGAAGDVDAMMGDNLSTTLTKLKRDAMAPLISGASTLSDMFQELPDGAQAFVGGLAGVVGVAAPAAWGISKVVDIGSSAIDTFSSLTTKVGGLGRAGKLAAGAAGVGALTAGLALVSTEMAKLDDEASRARFDKFFNMDSLVANFKRGGDEADKYMRRAVAAAEMTGDWEMATKNLATRNVDLANAFVDAAEGSTLSKGRADELRSIIDDTATATGDMSSETDDAAAAQRSAASSYLGSEQAVDGLTDSVVGQVTALKDMADALQAQFDPLFGMMDALWANRDAQAAVAEAERNLTEAKRAHGAQSLEAMAAQDELTRAQRDATGSAMDLTGAAGSLTAGIRGNTVSLADAKAQLAVWVGQGLITQSTANSMARQFDIAAYSSGGMANQMWGATGAANALGRSDPSVWASLMDGVSGPLGWIQGRADALDGRSVDVRLNLITTGLFGALNRALGLLPPGYDVGGVVPGPIGAPQLAVVHGGETIFPTHNPPAMRAMAAEYGSTLTGAGAQPAAGGAPVTMVQVSMAGAIIASSADAERWVADAWNRAAAKGAVNVRGRRLSG